MTSISSQNYFKKSIFISCGIHVLAFVLAMMLPYRMVSKKNVIKEAIRVDMVGLPDLVAPPVKKVVPKPKPKPAPPVKKKKIVKKKKPKKVEPKKEKPKPKQEKPKTPEPQESSQLHAAQLQAIQNLKETPEPPTYKGEQISKGESLQGEVDHSLRDWYFTRVKAHIKMFWNLPRLLADKDLKATVVIEANKEGNIMKIRLEKSSGHEGFDQIVIDTIRQSSPLPAPPSELQSMLREGVGFNFPD